MKMIIQMTKSCKDKSTQKEVLEVIGLIFLLERLFISSILNCINGNFIFEIDGQIVDNHTMDAMNMSVWNGWDIEKNCVHCYYRYIL